MAPIVRRIHDGPDVEYADIVRSSLPCQLSSPFAICKFVGTSHSLSPACMAVANRARTASSRLALRRHLR
jgi:hypothetical protein